MAKIVKDSQVKKNNNQKVILLSFVISTFLLVLKFFAYYLTHSNAILTDAVESIVNVVASAFASYSVYLASQPRDFNHPYGHGKIEFFSSGLEGILILLAGIFTLIPSINSLVHPKTIELSITGLVLVLISLLINLLLGLFLKNYGTQHHSVSIQADGMHLLTDAISSVFLLVGLLIVKFTGILAIDALLGIILACIIIFNGYKISRKSITGLMDETDSTSFERILVVINSHRKNEWIDVHNLRVQKHGADTHIDCHLTLPYYISLEKAHEEVISFENIFRKEFEKSIEIFTHTDPCIPECCSYCQLENCQVRTTTFDKRKEWTAELLFENKKHFEHDSI